MNFGDIDWVSLCVLVLGVGLMIGGCFMIDLSIGLIAIGFFLTLGSLIASRAKVG